MTDNNEISEKTARRLKELRESKRLSHIGLCEELSRLYGIKISKSSLINYEATDFSSKSGSNAGMKIEYLRCFADFYGVSADYILGLSDYQTPSVNAKAAIDCTGLSENSINILCNAKSWGFGKELTSVIDALLFDFEYATKGESIAPLFYLINWFLEYSGNGKVDKMVHINGEIVDCHNANSYIPSSVKLNDRIIENAALMEIQQGLISLKKRLLRKER